MILVIDAQLHRSLLSKRSRTKGFFPIPAGRKLERAKKKSTRQGTVDCFFFFALASICAPPECAKSSSYGNACYAGYHNPMLSLHSILWDFSIYDL